MPCSIEYLWKVHHIYSMSHIDVGTFCSYFCSSLNLYLRCVLSSSRYLIKSSNTPIRCIFLSPYILLSLCCSLSWNKFLFCSYVILVASYSPFHLRDQNNFRFKSLHLFPAIYLLIPFKRIYIPIFVIMPRLSVLICIL